MSRTLTANERALSPDNAERLVLYSTDLSPCARRVRITLLEKGLPFDLVDVDLANMQQRSPQYLALNPNGFVPTLAHGEQVIFESGVINEYLEAQFPQVSLMPVDPFERAQVRMWMAAEGAMAKTFRAVMYQRLMGPIHHLSRTHEEAREIAARSTDDPQDLSWESRVWHLEVLTPPEEAREEATLYAWLDDVEVALQGRDYLVGNQFSQADISMYPRIAMYEYLGQPLHMRRYPNVLRWMGILEQRPSFEKSMTGKAKKLRALASSSLMDSVRKSLYKSAAKRSVLERLRLWGVGKLLRRMTGVDAQLRSDGSSAPLYLPSGKVESGSRPLPAPVPIDAGAMTLYGDPLSPFSTRLRLMLALQGMDAAFVALDPRSGESAPTELFTCNPQRELPILDHGGRIINGADTIGEYLQCYQAGRGLWQPGDSRQAALLRMWLALEAGNHKELTPLWQRYVCGVENVEFIADEAKSLGRIHNILGILDVALAATDFLCAAEPGYADLAWYTRLDSLTEVPGYTLQGLPHVENWLARMRNVIAAHTALLESGKPYSVGVAS